MKLRLLLTIVVMALASQVSQAQLLQWNTWANAGTETSEPSVANDANIAAANMTMSGLTTGANGNRFGGSTWGTSNPSTLAEAITNNDYIQFTVTPNAGYSFTATSLVFIWDRSGTGPSSVALRSSADGYAANLGTVTGIVSGAFATNTITITGLTNITVATTFRIYGYNATGGTGTGGFDTNVNAVNVTLNGTTAASSAKVSNGTGGGDWNTAATWNPVGVPANGDTVTILPSDNVGLAAGITRSASTTVNGTFQINTGGSVTGTAFTYGASGYLVFNTSGNYAVANTDPYWPAASGPANVALTLGGVTLNSTSRVISGQCSIGGSLGVTFNGGSTLTINGTCTINSGGFFNSNAVIYGSASTLIYNTGAPYGRGFEWMALGVGTIGVTPGYPNNVTVNTGTTLNYNNGTPLAKAMAGNLTINISAGFNMSDGGGASGGPLTVGGNVTLGGAGAVLTLGNTVGDDLKIGGNFTNGGTFNGNNRAIWFTKASGTQTVSSATSLAIPYVVFDTTGSRTVQLAAGTSVNVSAPLGGNAISFGSAADVFGIPSGQTLTIGTAGIANTISGSGSFSGTINSNISLIGSGSVGTMNFTTGSQNLGTFTINRTGVSPVACTLGTPLTIFTNLILTSGCLDLGNNPLTIAAAAGLTSSSTNYVIADGGYGSSASLRKIFTAAGAYTFPVGDRAASADGSQYSPVTVSFTGGTYASAYAGVAVNDIKHPNFDATSEYITRYWDVTTFGISAPTAFTANGTYLDVDVNAPAQEANYIGNKWNGTIWSNGGSPVNAATNVTNTVPCTVATTNHVTAGRRDADINVYGGASVVSNASGWTYNFGGILVGNTNAVTFTIQNIGQQILTVALPSTSPTAPYVYTTPYTAGNVSGPSGTKTFVVTFTPTAGGTFTGSIVIPSNDPDEASYTINFTGVGVVPAPEINIRGNSITIPPGNTPSGLDFTLFAGQTIATTSAPKIYEIQNLGTATLTLTGSYVTLGGAHPGDFAISAMPATSIAAAGNTTFNITFTPTMAGTRTATVTVYSDDADEPTYTFNIQGTGNCAVATNTMTPTSGPVGTEVTITAVANNLTGATVTFNGVAATVTPIDATHIKVVVPSGATTGNLVTTNAQGCTASNIFTVIDNAIASCEGGTPLSEIFISEVTDSNNGGLSYVELYNPTAAAINLSTGSYTLQTANNGGAFSFTFALTGTIAAGATYVVALGDDNSCATPGGDGSYAVQVSAGGGVNFTAGAHDHIGLFKAATKIDSWGVFGSTNWAPAAIGTNGATFRRKNTVSPLPNTTYNNSDWDIIDYPGTACANNDYSDVGIYDFSTGIPPTVTQNPTYTPSCKAIAMTVAGAEGYVPGNPLAYQWYAVAPNTTTWTALANAGVYSGVTTATLNISNIAGLDGYQFYCQIRENSATCYTATNAIKINEALTCTWNGSSWSPSAPTIGNIAVINGSYNTSVNGDIDACSLVVNSPATLTISPNDYVNIQNDLTVNLGATLSVQDDASLVMVDDAGVVTNSGTTQVTRITAPYRKFDYTYWSSPVANANIGTTFTGWRTDYSFHFNTANFMDVLTASTGLAPADGFDDNGDAWQFAGPATTMVKGKGYAIMGPTSVVFSPTAVATVNFSGAVNNGVVTIPLAQSQNGANTNDDFNLIGNPYPSALSGYDFINANAVLSNQITGTLYFWTHNAPIAPIPGPNQYNFITADYASYTMSGGVASATGSAIPTGEIASGTGFFVEAATGATAATFNNSMRSKTYSNNQFFRMASSAHASVSQKDRLWLNFTHANGLFSQQLVAYFQNTTLGVDNAYDGRVNPSQNSVSFYSLIENDAYRIQARPSFDVNDIVSLGYYAMAPGNYTIAIGQTEGVFADAATPVYLEDKWLNVIHNLKESAYSFDTQAGTFDERFQLRYTESSLGNPDVEIAAGNVFVAAADGVIKVTSPMANIESVAVYDILGRQLFMKSSIDAHEFTIGDMARQQALIVKVTLDNGATVSKKVMSK